MSAPDISGVIPSFNRAALLTRAIQSMLAQTRPPIEIIVVDDGSTDATREEVAAFGDKVRYVFQQNAGGAAARNHGVRLARTAWVAFLDSDDVWMPQHLERIGRAIEITKGVADLYFADMLHEIVGGEESRWERAGLELRDKPVALAEATEWVMLEHQPMMLQTSVVRRARFLEVGGLWEVLRTAHDTHFFLKMGIGSVFCAVAGFGAMQTQDDVEANRLTTRSGPVRFGRWVNTARLYADILERFPGLDPGYQALLRRRVCKAHWRAARISSRNGDNVLAIRHGWLALRSCSQRSLDILFHREKGYHPVQEDRQEGG